MIALSWVIRWTTNWEGWVIPAVRQGRQPRPGLGQRSARLHGTLRDRRLARPGALHRLRAWLGLRAGQRQQGRSPTGLRTCWNWSSPVPARRCSRTWSRPTPGARPGWATCGVRPSRRPTLDLYRLGGTGVDRGMLEQPPGLRLPRHPRCGSRCHHTLARGRAGRGLSSCAPGTSPPTCRSLSEIWMSDNNASPDEAAIWYLQHLSQRSGPPTCTADVGRASPFRRHWPRRAS